MKQLIFWAGYLYLPFLLASVLILRTRGRKRVGGVTRLVVLLAVIIVSIVAYARFVEPRLLFVKQTKIVLAEAEAGGPSIKIALFSDTHFGVFAQAIPMRRIVERINGEAPDAVMIAGDFLYYLAPDDIPAALAPLADLQAPVFAVLGNHDVGFPGPVYTAELYTALTALGVTLVENRAHAVSLAGQEVIIAGTSDLWEQRQDFRFTTGLPDVPVFLLTHNPDTAFELPQGFDYDLMLAGHTHGGQIRIPGLVHKVIPTVHPFDKELHVMQIGGQSRRIYVTTGTGMVGLPFRLAMPPRIDMLTVIM